MQLITQELARLRHEVLLRAAAADRSAALARGRQRKIGARWAARRLAGGSRPDRLADLARVPLFQGFSRRDLRALAHHADPFTAREGTVLARGSHPAPQFVVIGHGIAEATREGRRVAMYTSGDHFGEFTLLEGEPQVPTVVALTDVSGYVFGRRGFWSVVNGIPTLAIRLATRIAEDLAHSEPVVRGSGVVRAVPLEVGRSFRST